MAASRRSSTTKVLLLVLGMTVARPAVAADDPVTAARHAYERGAEAYDAGQYEQAARAFAKADELSPHPVALEYALRAAMRAQDAVLVMQLVQRVEARAHGESLARLAAQARRAFERKVGRIFVHCRPDERCQSFRVGGVSAEPGTPRWVEPGEHVVTIILGDTTETRRVVVEGGRDVLIEPNRVAPAPPPSPSPTRTSSPAPALPPTTEADQSRGWSPAWFWLGVGTTAALGVATTISGLDTLSKHDAFEKNQTDATEEAGRSAQTRTNLLLGGTAVAALATASVGAFATGWNTEEKEGNKVGFAFGRSTVWLSVEGAL